MLPELRSGKIRTFALAGHLAVGHLARGNFGHQRGVRLQFAVEIRLEPFASAFFWARAVAAWMRADDGMHGAALGGEGEQGDARADAEQMPGKLRGGDGDVGELIARWVRG